MDRYIFKKGISVLSAAIVLIAAYSFWAPAPCVRAAETLTVDGDISDWEGVTRHTGGGSLSSWAVLKDDTGYYFLIKPAPYQEYSGQSISITYEDGNSSGIVFNVASGRAMTSSWADIPGASSSGMFQVNGENYEEFFVPASYFASADFTLTSNESVQSSDIEVVGDSGGNETGETSEGTEATDPATGVYEGIVIDGSFDDWASVVKVDATAQSNGLVNGVAMVWDGDYIYLLIDEKQNNSASWSGNGNNGNFVITTDTNHVMIINFKGNQPNPNTVSATVTSTNVKLTSDNGGLECASNPEYSVYDKPSLTEIKIPTSALPDYRETISFGYYLSEEPLIADVANLHPVEHNSGTNDGSNIVIDGRYEDWENYPVTTIEYATAGTSNNWADSEAGIYSRDGLTYVYAESHNFSPSTTGDHYGGEEFLEITVSIPGKGTTKMEAVLIRDDGSLDWDASKRHFEPGTYHFALFEQSGYGKSTSLDNIVDHDYYYGDMYVTVGDYIDKTEFVFDPSVIAEYFGTTIEPSDKVNVMLHRCGDENLYTSGISTGPIFTVLLAGSAAALFYIYTKSKRKAKAES